MPARYFKDRADYVSVILEVAKDELAEDPQAQLYKATNCNLSGGHEYWGLEADSVYREPNTLEEALVALELRSVLEHATRNQLRNIAVQACEESVDLSIMGLPMDMGVFLSTAKKLAVRNPLAALDCKILASRIAHHASDLPLTDFLTTYCLTGGITGTDFCNDL